MIQLNKRTIFYLVTLIVFLFLAVYLTPKQVGKINKVLKDIKELQTKIETTNSGVASKSALEEKSQQIKSDIAELSGKVPPLQNLSAIQAYLSALAKEADLEITETGSTPPQPTKTINDTKFYTITITIQARCGYHQLGRFITAIEKRQYPINITGLGITGGKPYHNVRLVLAILTKG